MNDFFENINKKIFSLKTFQIKTLLSTFKDFKILTYLV